MEWKKFFKSEAFSLLFRYLLIVGVAIPNLYLFYFLLTPITVKLSYLLIKIAYPSSVLEGNIIFIGETSVKLIKACIAGSAYYLLFFLNLSVPRIKILKRISMVVFGFALFLIINIVRIYFLVWMYFSYGYNLFESFHKVLWYGLGSVFIVVVWFIEVKVFSIQKIPVVDDLKNLYKSSLLGKKND